MHVLKLQGRRGVSVSCSIAGLPTGGLELECTVLETAFCACTECGRRHRRSHRESMQWMGVFARAVLLRAAGHFNGWKHRLSVYGPSQKAIPRHVRRACSMRGQSERQHVEFALYVECHWNRRVSSDAEVKGASLLS